VERLEAESAGLKQAGAPDVHTLALDVRDADEVEQAVRDLPDAWKNIDILVNNAGLSRGLEKLHEGKLQDWEEMIDTNVKGLLYVSRAVIPGMVERGRGHVVNLGSTAGHMTYPGGAVYCATKAAEKSITEGMREDLLGTDIRVTTVDPGMVETEFSEVRFRGDTGRAANVYQNVTPLRPEDVADAILYAVTRPPHVNVSTILITPVAQANSLLIHRKQP
jgi:NADP-dependent 3-hydroxy acid dehydrogenase YdfG